MGGTTLMLLSRMAISEERRFVVTDIGPGRWLLSASPVGDGVAPLGVMAVTELGAFRSGGVPVGAAVFLETNTAVEFDGSQLWLTLPVVDETQQQFLDVRLERAEVPEVEAAPRPRGLKR